MRKIFASIAVVALAFTATPAFAHGGDDDSRVSAKASVRAALSKHGWAWGKHQFAISGTVSAVSSNSLTVDVKKDDNRQVLVSVNSDTKIYGKDKTVLVFSDIKVGDKVKLAGSMSGSVLVASQIVNKSRPQVIAMGQVTAKTDNSVTITNSTTGQSQTVAVNGDTNIAINGQEAGLADISVGDVGWVKFKNVAGDLVAKIIRLFR